jgi:hypothetical protein
MSLPPGAAAPHADESDQQRNGDLATLTFVVRVDSLEPDGYDFDEAVALIGADTTQFFAVEPGVAHAARSLGAEPGAWEVGS